MEKNLHMLQKSQITEMGKRLEILHRKKSRRRIPKRHYIKYATGGMAPKEYRKEAVSMWRAAKIVNLSQRILHGFHIFTYISGRFCPVLFQQFDDCRSHDSTV